MFPNIEKFFRKMRKLLFFSAMLALCASCNNNAGKETVVEDPEQITVDPTSLTSDFKVAYIQVDTLMSEYLLAEELRNTFQAKANKAERELNAKAQKLEQDMIDAQEKVQKGLVTRATAEQLQQTLAQQQQELMNTRDRMMAELAEEEQVMNNRIYYAVMDYLSEFNADYKYSMILSTTASGPILHAQPAMNITQEVLAALNQKYNSEKESK